jgi:hypothetical protein
LRQPDDFSATKQFNERGQGVDRTDINTVDGGGWALKAASSQDPVTSLRVPQSDRGCPRIQAPTPVPDQIAACISLFATVDGKFGTIGLGEPGFVLKTGRDRAIANHTGVAQLIEREELRGERMAARVSLAAHLINAYLQRS